jgi:hypothetical protein
MRRRLIDPFLAAGPLAVAVLAAASTLAGALALAVLVAVAARSAFPGHRRRRGRGPSAPVVVVAPLEPRRPRARPHVSVAAVAAGGAAVRALRPGELHGGRVRRGGLARRVADPALRAACLHVATRANARLTDAAAVRLGLADAPLSPPASDPDPLLLVASWG